MNGLLTEIGKKLAERWTVPLLPGVLFATVAVVAVSLGQEHWSDVARVTAVVRDISNPPAGLTRTVVLLVALLATAFASGAVAQALALPTEHALAGRWGRLLRRAQGYRTRRRREAWEAADREWEEGRDTELRGAAVRRNRIALVRPAHATWIGDRLGAPAVRITQEYGLDLGTAWPRLWFIFPPTTREPLSEGRRRVDDATRLGGWALLYLLLGAVWWPASVVGLVTGLVAWRRARTAVGRYAELVEAAVDMHVAELWTRFVEDGDIRPSRPQWGRQVTELFRKGV